MTGLADLANSMGKTPHFQGSIADRHAGNPEIDDAQSRPAAIKATIVVVEPRVLIRDCLTRCLQAITIHRVLACASTAECQKLVERLPGPFVFLFHASDQDTAAEIERDLRLLNSLAPTVVMAESEEANQILQALDHGAKGYIPTSISIDVALEALRLVIAGGLFVPASSLLSPRRSVHDLRYGRRNARFGLFTDRQAAVVEALRQGKANKIIAYELNMRESTVKVHVRNIMRKLNARNWTEVAYLTSNRPAAQV